MLTLLFISANSLIHRIINLLLVYKSAGEYNTQVSWMGRLVRLLVVMIKILKDWSTCCLSSSETAYHVTWANGMDECYFFFQDRIDLLD
jgi:hypothetical protein